MNKQGKAINKKPVVEESEDDDSDIDIVQKKPASNLPAKKTFVKSDNHSLKPENGKKPEVKHVGKAAPALAKRKVEESDESDDSEEVKKPVKKVKQQKKQAESSDEDSDEAPMKQEKLPAKAPVQAKTGPVKKAAPKPADSSDEDSDEKPAPARKASKVSAKAKNDDSDSDDKPAPRKPSLTKPVPAQAAKKPVPVKKPAADSSDEDSDEKPAPKKAQVQAKVVPQKKAAKPAESDEDEDSDEKPAPKKVVKAAEKPKVVPQKKQPVKEDSDEDEDSDEKPAPKKAQVQAKQVVQKKAAAKPAEDSDDDDDSDEKPAPKKAAPAKKPVKKVADEDDEEEAPAPKGKKQNGGAMMEEHTPFQAKTFDRQQGGKGQNAPFDNSTEVIVKGLSYNVTEDQIWEHFGNYGTVSTVKCLSKDDGSFRGVCFVKFADNSVVDAVVADSGKEFAGRQLWIEKTKPKGEREVNFNQGQRGGGFGGDRGGNFGGNRGGFGGDRQQGGGEKFHTNQDNTVFVGNLTYNTVEDSIWNAFASVGNIKEVRIAKDQEGNSRGFAHVEFLDGDSAQKALSMGGTKVDGRPIRVDTSTKKSGGDGGHPGGRGGRGGRGGGFGGGRGGFNRQGHDSGHAPQNEIFEF